MLFILIIIKYKKSEQKIFYFVLIIFISVLIIMILELVICIINFNKYTDYYKNCPFYFESSELNELNKSKNRRCLNIENNNYICSYNASSGIYSFNYCLYSKYDVESNQRLDINKVVEDIVCDKFDYNTNNINLNKFISNKDFYYCNRKTNFKKYSNIDNKICNEENVCDEKSSILGIIKVGIIIDCFLFLLIFIIFLCKIYRKEYRGKKSENNIVNRNINTTSNLNTRRNRKKENESNCSTEGNKNQEEIKDFKIENAENILVENKNVYMLTSNIMTISTTRREKRAESEVLNINNEKSK